ncbi:Aste57867_950 [Aphanomyces stellatus]|uniref:Aste57867_950 protein n=1 Tax=Aphanomyces stellatus TaxID=120398 RepID=A0A485K819_9STRA|nr:hypothetical protein As57867_000949 [Aphanomyces stellatus]VFT78173.1 Aste57867_950 [Aphanomyces stellatus]
MWWTVEIFLETFDRFWTSSSSIVLRVPLTKMRRDEDDSGEATTTSTPAPPSTENTPPTTENILIQPTPPADDVSLGKRGRQPPMHNEGRWRDTEHDLFLEGLRRYGRQWFNVAKVVKTRSVTQIRTHAQKYFAKQEREVNTLLEHLEPPRPRKKCRATSSPTSTTTTTVVGLPPVLSPVRKPWRAPSPRTAFPMHQGLEALLSAAVTVPSPLLSLAPAPSSPPSSSLKHLLKRGLDAHLCSRLKQLVESVNTFVKRRLHQAINLTDMHMHIEGGGNVTLEDAVVALLVRVKTLKGGALVSDQVQHLILSELSHLLHGLLEKTPPALPPVPTLQLPPLLPRPSQISSPPHKLPRLSEWAPTASLIQ